MAVRRWVAVWTGWFYRAARRLRIPTTASRQADLQLARRLPDTPPVDAGGINAGAALRVLLLGNGPAESPGLRSGAAAFPSYLAEALAARTARPVQVKTLIGGDFDLALLKQRLGDEHLHEHDALVVTAAYRAQLAEVPLARWRLYTDELRAVLVQAAGPQTVIRVLALPWRDAARRAPLQWGGLFGNRVRVVAEIAEATLAPDQPAKLLRLHAPVMSREWDGPSFSAQTYLLWAAQVAAELADDWRV